MLSGVGVLETSLQTYPLQPNLLQSVEECLKLKTRNRLIGSMGERLRGAQPRHEPRRRWARRARANPGALDSHASGVRTLGNNDDVFSSSCHRHPAAEPPVRAPAPRRNWWLVIVAPLGHRERRASARYCRFMVTAVAKIRPLTGWWRSARRPAARVASHRSGRALELDLQLQRESVALEREKVRLECDKLALEREEIGIKRARVEHASRCSSSSASASETQWR